MPSSKMNSYELAEDLAKSLEATTSLMQSLLGEIRDNATSLAVLKERLESLAGIVKNLSHIVRDGNGKRSLVTRFALMEKDLENLDENIVEYKKELDDAVSSTLQEMKKAETLQEAKTLSMWKVAAVAIPGIVALIITLIKIIGGEAP